MTFNDAFALAKQGKKIRRIGWNGNPAYIELATSVSYETSSGGIVNCDSNAVCNQVFAFIGASGVLSEWFASASDMLANDWELAEVEPSHGLKALRDALRFNTYKQKYHESDIIEDFGYRFQIIGFNHDRQKVTMTNNTATVMAMELLPPHRMHDNGKCKGWADSGMRVWLNNDILRSLPDGLQALIQPTERFSINTDETIEKTVDKLFLPTESELFGSAIYSLTEYGARYPVFVSSAARVRYDEDGDPDWYWTSSVYSGDFKRTNRDYTPFVFVDSDGHVDYYSHDKLSPPLCFQIS